MPRDSTYILHHQWAILQAEAKWRNYLTEDVRKYGIICFISPAKLLLAKSSDLEHEIRQVWGFFSREIATKMFIFGLRHVCQRVMPGAHAQWVVSTRGFPITLHSWTYNFPLLNEALASSNLRHFTEKSSTFVSNRRKAKAYDIPMTCKDSKPKI